MFRDKIDIFPLSNAIWIQIKKLNKKVTNFDLTNKRKVK